MLYLGKNVWLLWERAGICGISVNRSPLVLEEIGLLGVTGMAAPEPSFEMDILLDTLDDLPGGSLFSGKCPSLLFREDKDLAYGASLMGGTNVLIFNRSAERSILTQVSKQCFIVFSVQVLLIFHQIYF